MTGAVITVKADESALLDDFSVVVGGPVYDFLRRTRLVRQGLPNIERRIIAMVAIAWVPLLILSLKDGLAFGNRVTMPFLVDFSVYARLLFGLPLLLIAEIVIDPSIHRTIGYFVSSKIVGEAELARFRKVLRNAQRLRDTALLELALLALAFFPVFMFQQDWSSEGIASWHGTAAKLTQAGWWFASVSTPMFRFLLYRWLYRYVVWSLLLWRIGGINLRLMPTHPDQLGGLGFVVHAQRRFGILLVALGCVFAGQLANHLVFEGATLQSFQFLIIGYVMLALLIGLAPLVLLAPPLIRVKRQGLLEYGRLANRYTTEFDGKWIGEKDQERAPLLGTSDIQSLADLGNTYAIIRGMRIVPITKSLVIQLTLQAGAPLIPIIIAGSSIDEIIHSILKMVL